MADATDMMTYTAGITRTDKADTGEKECEKGSWNIHLGIRETVTTARCSTRAEKTW